MSFDAVDWAARQDFTTATAKLVLVGLGHYANKKALAWPSNDTLAAFAGIHRRTVGRILRRLEMRTLIEDSGERRGTTKRVKVWRLRTDQDSLPLSGNSGNRSHNSNRRNSGNMRPHSSAPNEDSYRGIVPRESRNGDSLESHRILEQDSVTNVTGSGGAPDPVKQLFDIGVALLVETGVAEKEARSLIGKWRKGGRDGEVMSALVEARARAISNPKEWLSQRLKPARYVSAGGFEYRGDLDAVEREAERRSDWGIYWQVRADRRRANGEPPPAITADTCRTMIANASDPKTKASWEAKLTELETGEGKASQ